MEVVIRSTNNDNLQKNVVRITWPQAFKFLARDGVYKEDLNGKLWKLKLTLENFLCKKVCTEIVYDTECYRKNECNIQVR